MRSSLVNSFLGILTTSEVHELIDVFKGKGRRPITPYLVEYLENIDIKQNGVSAEDSNHVLLHQVSQDNNQVILEDLGAEEVDSTELKGVLFILDSFRKTKKYQQLLKSREIFNLYNKTNSEAIGGLNDQEVVNTAKSKGILINKKHF